jgi:hypothetical protein
VQTSFFTSLQEKIESLRKLERPHPLNTAVAVEMVKRYVVEPRYRIRLHDLVREETEQVYQKLVSEGFSPSVPLTKELFQERLQQYEGVVERLMTMLVALAYHDTGENAYLLTDCIEHLLHLPSSHGGYPALLNLRYYPALLLLYAAGISALASKRFRNLASTLGDTRYRDETTGKKRHAIEKLHVWSVFEETYKWVPRPRAEREYTPANNYLFERLQPILRDYLPNKARYEEIFDTFEYLLALTYMDVVENSNWAPIGRFGWRYRDAFVDERDWGSSPMADFVNTGLRLGRNWGLFQAGFFQGSVKRFQDIVIQHRREVRQW